MSHWFGTQGQEKMAKITQNPSTCDVPTRKAQTQNEKNFFRSAVQDLLNL